MTLLRLATRLSRAGQAAAHEYTKGRAPPRLPSTPVTPYFPRMANTTASSPLAESLQAAMNAARKAQDKERTLVLGTIIANLKNRRIELRREPTDDEVVEVIRKGIKLRREATEQYEKAGRPELAKVELGQIAVLEEFLPPAVDPEEIRQAVRAAIAGGAKDIGKVMGQVLPKFKGRTEGKVINDIVREELQKG